MKYQLLPKALRTRLIGRILFVTFFIFIFPTLMKYLEPNSSMVEILVAWRFPMVLFYGIISFLGFYSMGLFGSCTFSYDGITFKRSYQEKLIPWDEIDKIVPTQSAQSLEIVFKPEYKNKYKGKIVSSYAFERTDEAIHDIKQYFDNIKDT